MRVPSGDQRGDTPICADVLGLTRVHDSFAVGRDLRIRRYLDTKNVHGLQAIGDFLSIDGQRGKHEECS